MVNNAKIEQLKRKLSEELVKDNSDNSLIISLSNEIASLDEKLVRFSVDAGIINRLGKELVGRHETAVAELVKNAYDADATTVDLYFENTEKKGGRLTIIDNGHGMTRDQLIFGFMKISSSDKIHNPKSPRYNRTRAGQKGIGRFATHRLGNYLTIISQTKENSEAIKVEIDWADYKIDQDINLISNKLEWIPKDRLEGTIIIIDDLRDIWSEGMLKRAFRYVSELLQPYPLSELVKENTKEPGFKASFYQGNIDNAEPIVDVNSEFYNYATAIIEGYVDSVGDGYYSLSSTYFNFPEDLIEIGANSRNEKYKPFKFLRNIHIKIYYFIYYSGLIPKQSETIIRRNAEIWGGIRLYRNGFRVLPYGEVDNDWLGLDASVRRRVILAPHGNNNFYGFIEINDSEGVNFQELSSREGLFENDALKELRDFTYKVITDAAIKVSAERGKKSQTTQKDWEPKKPKEILDDVAAKLEKAAEKKEQEEKSDDKKSKTEENDNDFSSNDFRDFAQRIKDANYEQEKKTSELLQEIQLLRILSSLGLIIGEFIHEIKHHLDAFELDIHALIRDHSEEQDVLKKLERLALNSSSFRTYTSYFDKAVSENVNRELEPIEIRDVVKPFYKVAAPNCERIGIELISPEFNGYDLFTCPMHKSEWASILFNFFSNSKKAIKRAGANGKILVQAGRVNNQIYLDFSDNGDGIPVEHQEKVFDPFFTTSSPSGKFADEIEEMTGTGLGLKIVKDIIEGYNGDIYIREPEEGYATTIRVIVPVKND
ncbi:MULTISPECIES: sensor histidine kinase [unclassified Carboxylicivirga]|uniref:sensor histidine kinase n=1 Tax=Carboxylicivirga TaxID=1628153 RepID=UPI003D347CC8